MKISIKDTSFQTKLDQAVEMVIQPANYFVCVDITVVCDSWFGNNGLFKPLRKHIRDPAHLISRLHSNAVLYTIPQNGMSKKTWQALKIRTQIGFLC